MNKRKKILLMGVIDSPYILHMVEDVLVPLEYEVYYCDQGQMIKNSFHSLDRIHVLGYVNKCIGIHLFYNLIRRIKLAVQLFFCGNFDYILLNFVTLRDVQRAVFYKRKKTKLFLYYWGSDLLQETIENKNLIKKYFHKVDCFFSDACVTRDAFYDFYGKSYPFEIIYFGDKICDLIPSVKKEDNIFHFDMGKTLVAVGYNAREMQQHIKVLQEIAKHQSDFMDYQFILQMNYNRDDENYCNKVKNFLEESGLNYVIVDNYLSENDLAILRNQIAVFINAEETDAFCSSIKEYFCSKTRVLNPIWLHYEELDTLNLNYIEYREFKEIPDLLLNCKKIISEEKLKENQYNLTGLLSWEECKNNWSKFLR